MGEAHTEKRCPVEPSMHGVGVLCQVLGRFCFPLGPVQGSAVVGAGSCSPTGTSFFSVLQALPMAEEVPASAAASAASRCCRLW